MLMEASEKHALADYAAKAYLSYALAVVKGRALPDVRDGLKPVQRRILHAMNAMGLDATTKPVKSARVVGDVIGKYHPHGDSSVYEAMVRVSQDFSLRYPLVDGHGNFGSRDGDSAAAMRYTEARLTPYASLFLDELKLGTVDFRENYDGAFTEPVSLPARLPFILLNGASGIAVGMATEIPSHNMREVAQAAVHMIRHPEADTDAMLEFISGPDYPCGGQIISSREDIAAAYRTGRGSIRLRARWRVEELARGQWQIVVYELPQGVSTQKVMAEVEAMTNPQPKSGKKAVEQEALQTKALMLTNVDRVRDESGREADVRIVIEPKRAKQDPDELMALLLANTSLECSSSINMVMIGIDGRPAQKALHQVIQEWCQYRVGVVRRRSQHRLGQVEDRIHILEGRQTVLLNIDEVIAIIREAEDPKAALIERFKLSDRQAEDILEIRLRQLARLEAIKIQQELSKLMTEKASLERLLGSNTILRNQIIREIEADMEKFGDDRRTLIEPTQAASKVAIASVVDEPITVVLSRKGWVRARQGHGVDASVIPFKEGDSLAQLIECRSVDPLIVITDGGRAITCAASCLPDGRGAGVPLVSLIEMPSGARITHVIAAPSGQKLLMTTSKGFGFTCMSDDLVASKRAGKQFFNLAGGMLLKPHALNDAMGYIFLVSSAGKALMIQTQEINHLSGGGKGVTLMGIDEKDTLTHVLPLMSEDMKLSLEYEFRGKEGSFEMSETDLIQFEGRRARKGKMLPLKQGWKLKSL